MIPSFIKSKLERLDLRSQDRDDAIFTKSNSTFYGDRSATKQHVEFLNDQKFIKARNYTYCDAPLDIVRRIQNTNIDWRIHIVTWAASKCMHLDGDFVECGVWWGWLSRAICHYTEFEKSEKLFHFYDSWGAEGSHQNYKDDIFNQVKNRFTDYPNVVFHRGMIPDSLYNSEKVDKVAYLSLDMNGGLAERQALEILYDKIVPGGIIYIDDYGWNFPRLRAELSDFLSDKPEKILHFPCGSSIIEKI